MALAEHKTRRRRFVLPEPTHHVLQLHFYPFPPCAVYWRSTACAILQSTEPVALLFQSVYAIVDLTGLAATSERTLFLSMNDSLLLAWVGDLAFYLTSALLTRRKTLVPNPLSAPMVRSFLQSTVKSTTTLICVKTSTRHSRQSLTVK